MFQLLRYNQDPATLSVDVIVEYEWKNNTIERIQKVFKEKQTADSWITLQRKNYGWSKLNAYVLHKKVLSECSHQWSSDRDRCEKIKSLEMCLREVQVVKEYPLWNLAKLIEVMYPQLVNILPMEHHLTFSSQRRIINDLWVFAQEVLQPR